MFENTNQVDPPLSTALEYLCNLPTNYSEAKLEAAERCLSQMSALTKLHRAWQLGCSRGIKSEQILKRMKAYFKYVFNPESCNAKTATQKDLILLGALKNVSIAAHLLNSVTYTIKELREVGLDIIEQMAQLHLTAKFLVLIWNDGFKRMAKTSITALGQIELTEVFVTFASQQDQLPTSPVKEPSYVRSTQIIHSKRSWNESEASQASIRQTDHATESRKRISIGNMVNGSNFAMSIERSTSQSNNRDASCPAKQMNQDRKVYGSSHPIAFESILKYWGNGLELFMRTSPTGRAYVSKCRDPDDHQLKSCISIWLPSTNMGDKMLKGDSLDAADLGVPEASGYLREPAGSPARTDPGASNLDLV
ncbi:hypothetical protein FocnCong_v011438 [Fusarium oxysporum f. sp. conglutinans]|nr:hypothetical protein FocnCong_v011438 [Fusarium oxysporum f. sp. conglutinans]